MNATELQYMIDNRIDYHISALRKEIFDYMNTKNARKTKKMVNPPTLYEFLEHAKFLCQKANLNFENLKFSIEQKYDSWVEAKWMDGHGKPIINWKSKLGNTIPYLKPIYNQRKEEPFILQKPNR